MKKLLAVVAILPIMACAVEKVPVATGGSRADALVELSYQVGGFEVAEVNWAAAQASALQRCRAWGFTQADPFDGTRNTCEAADIYGNCTLTTVTRTYQCL